MPAIGRRAPASAPRPSRRDPPLPLGQRALFALAALRERLAGGRFRPWDPAARFVTAVFPLPAVAAAALAEAADPLRRDGHLVYPPESIHLTVLNLDPWALGPDAARRVARALEGAGPVEVVVSGLGASRTGVLARAFSPDGSLLALRRALRAGLGPLPAGGRGHEPALRFLPVGFVSVARFSSPPGPAVAAVLRAGRGLRVGPLDLRALEVLSTNRVRSAARTEVLARLPL